MGFTRDFLTVEENPTQPKMRIVSFFSSNMIRIKQNGINLAWMENICRPTLINMDFHTVPQRAKQIITAAMLY